MTKEELELSLKDNQFEKNIEKLNFLIDKVKEKDFYLCKVKAYNDQSKQTVDNDKDRVKNLLAVTLQIPKLINNKLHINKSETYLFLSNKIFDLFNKDYIDYEDLIYSIRIELMEELKVLQSKKEKLILEKTNPIKKVEQSKGISNESPLNLNQNENTETKDKPTNKDIQSEKKDNPNKGIKKRIRAIVKELNLKHSENEISVIKKEVCDILLKEGFQPKEDSVGSMLNQEGVGNIRT